MTYDVDAVIQALHDQARPTLLQYMRPDSCIPSTRIGIDVLEYFGIHAKPLPLFVLVVNDAGIAMLDRGKTLNDVVDEAFKHTKEEAGGPWTIGLGAPYESRGGQLAEAGKWAGHLVIAIPQHRTLVDLSIDQISRPHKNITFTEPLVVVLDESSDPWWADEDPLYSLIVKDNAGHDVGLLLDRGPNRPDPEGYRRTLNWRRKSASGDIPFPHMTADVIRRMKAQLEAQ